MLLRKESSLSFDAELRFLTRKIDNIDPQTPPTDEPAWLINDPASPALGVSQDSTDAAGELSQSYPETDHDLHLRCPSPLRNPLKFVGWIVRTAFGIAALILLMAVIAAIPIVGFLALGFLLEAEGRVARSGRFRDGFPWMNAAPRIGSIALGIGMWLLPMQWVAGTAADAQLVDPNSSTTIILGNAAIAAPAVLTLHLLLALSRGGHLGAFFRPVKNVRYLISQLRAGGYWQRAGRHVGEFLSNLRLKHHFLLGLRGYTAAFVWLLPPTALFASANRAAPGPILLTVFGGICLVPVLLWLPLLQARLAADNRWRAAFELKTIREAFRRAPFASLVAIVSLYVLTLPLYLLKIAPPPRDAVWFVTIVFVASIWPARVLVGWAYRRGMKKSAIAAWPWRWGSRLLLIPLVMAYVVILFFTPFIDAHGRLVLFEHHAFLLPAPF
jgi:hypothetical protein